MSPTIFPTVVAVENVTLHTKPLGGSCSKCSKHAKVTGTYIHKSGYRVPIWLCVDHALENGLALDKNSLTGDTVSNKRKESR